MAITASQVKELRERTGIAMMKCKKALEETAGNLEAAVEHLRKQGEATADKKADRATNAGGLGIAFDGGKGALVLLSCETDFVSGNAEFKDFVGEVAAAALASGATDLDALAAAPMNGSTVKEAIVGLVAKMGENMQLATLDLVAGDVVAGYNHGGRVAGLVAGSGDAGALRNIAMHVAAANPAPLSLDRSGVPEDVVAKEREIESLVAPL
ncbi:MAG: translation elongation factor Ts, partial [Planctomycetota bacterium]|nr:translation elongation factor Ts [Planctomycetota bacterium]